MKYFYIGVYRVRGVTLPADGPARDVIEDAKVVARLLPNAESVDERVAQRTALANMMLDGGLGLSSALATFDERWKSSTTAVTQSWRQKFGGGAFLQVTICGEADYTPSTVREVNDIEVSFDGFNLRSLRDAARPVVARVLTSIGLSVESVKGIDKVAEAIVGESESGKRVFTFVPEANATAFVSQPPPTSFEISTTELFALLASHAEFDRVSDLLAASSEETDDFRAFILAFTALEILVNKAFKSHEREFFEELREEAPAGRKIFLDRMSEVMSDKYRLTDKFGLISSRLDPSNHVSDLDAFKKLKRKRDAIAHGQDLRRGGHPASQVRDIAHKYLRLHLRSLL